MYQQCLMCHDILQQMMSTVCIAVLNYGSLPMYVLYTYSLHVDVRSAASSPYQRDLPANLTCIYIYILYIQFSHTHIHRHTYRHRHIQSYTYRYTYRYTFRYTYIYRYTYRLFFSNIPMFFCPPIVWPPMDI